MRNFFKFAIFINLIILISFSSLVFATSPNDDIQPPSTSDLNIHSDCIILVEKDSGNVLYEKNAYQKMYPASTTKIMTAIIVLESSYLNEVVTVSQSAISAVPPTYSVAGLKARRRTSCNRFALHYAYSFCK